MLGRGENWQINEKGNSGAKRKPWGGVMDEEGPSQVDDSGVNSN